MENYIVFSSGHNCSKYVHRHLHSIQNQTFKDFIHIAVDDGSTDNTSGMLMKYKDYRTIVHRSEKVQRVAKSWIDYLKPVTLRGEEKVVIWIGMDDWLFTDRAFEIIHEVYTKKNPWLTYGSFIYLSNPNKVFPIRAASRRELAKRNFRAPPNQSIWLYQPLQTFKAFLFNNVRESDFKGPDGEWIPSSNDRALMYAMLEMTPSNKIQHIQDILYVYNDHNPLCVHKSGRLEEQIKYEYLAYSRPKYSILGRK